jgi:hypothetical protein
MRIYRVFLFLFLAGFLVQSVVAQERVLGAISNWSAPAFWSPTGANGKAAGDRLRVRERKATLATPEQTSPLPFIGVNPCRVADTRGNDFADNYGPPSIPGNSTRTFVIAGQCGIPAAATAVSFNFTVTNVTAIGDLRAFPANLGSTPTSILNWTATTGTVANFAVVALSDSGAITVQVDGVAPVDLIIDVNGYYAGVSLGALGNGSRRGALNQWWTPTPSPLYEQGFGITTVGLFPSQVVSDGADLWVTSRDSTSVSRVRASDGKLLETWTGTTGTSGIIVAMGRVFVAGYAAASPLFMIDPSQPAGPMTTVVPNVGAFAWALTFDGSRLWVVNSAISGGSPSVAIVTPGSWAVTTLTGFFRPVGLLFDGSNVWMTQADGKLLKFDANGNVIQTVTVSCNSCSAGYPVFDGTNIWVPSAGALSVVRASTGALVATLTGNGLGDAFTAAFDGDRVLVANVYLPQGVSLWRVSDLSPLGFYSIGGAAYVGGVCSDGLNFWLLLRNGADLKQLARF